MNTVRGIKDVALDHLVELGSNSYPGRGIIIGMLNYKVAVQVYWIMGRSENSRNRIFSTEGSRVFTEAADPSKMKDASLIIYNAMNELHGQHVVSNGNQTDTVIQAIIAKSEMTLRDALVNRQYEPDDPNFTPRITGMHTVKTGGKCLAELSILKKSPLVSRDSCTRFHYEYGHIVPGFGFCITTYNGDGNPLPAFTGEPFSLPIEGDINQVADTYWRALNPENRVSLAVKFIDTVTGKVDVKVVNSHEKVVVPQVVA